MLIVYILTFLAISQSLTCHESIKTLRLEPNTHLNSCVSNICQTDPCSSIKHAIPNTCSSKHTYTFENETFNFDCLETDFKCKCVNHTIWSIELNKCLIVNPCIAQTSCGGHQRAETCKFNEKTLEVKCGCKPSSMGENCELERNACEKNYHGYLKSGHEMCSPNGICKPILGYNKYTCECNPGWTNNKTFAQNNCRKQISKCDSLICINGFCEESNKTARCVCDYEWGGESCNEQLIGWLPWGDWSACLTQNENKRFRKRQRECYFKNLSVCLDLNPNAREFEVGECSRTNLKGLFPWSEWSRCDAECGHGFQYRTKMCTVYDFVTNKCMDKVNKVNRKKRKCFLKNCRYLGLEALYRVINYGLTVAFLVFTTGLMIVYLKKYRN